MTTEFFDATPQLQTIRQWARARYAAPWAVFGAVLLRVAASTPPNVQLPGIIGGRASLNLYAAFVSPSGGGKGISDKVSRLVWPADIHEEGMGSGEGMADLFKPKKDDEQVTRALIFIPEIDTMTGLAQRQGNTVLATLKAAAMGERLGSKGASSATTRQVPPHSYRLCLSVGGQPGHTGVIFDDTTGGTPQRFLWFLTIDPDMPADAPDDPEPLSTVLPTWKADESGVVEITYGPEHIATTVVEAHLARQRGEADALDGHAMLTRLKVAATLAILHKRSVVSELDWELSGAVMAQSNRTRGWVLSESRKLTRQQLRERALARAHGEEVIDDRRLDVVKRRIARRLERGPESRNVLRRGLGKKEYRDLFDAAIDSLLEEGAIAATEAEKGGTGYELCVSEGSPVTQEVTSPEQAKQGVTPEVTGDPEIMAAPVTGDPPVTPENPSSGLVTPEVTGDPLLTLTCAQWLRRHVLALMADEVDTVESRDLFAAGEAAGYNIDNLRRCVMNCDLIATVGRTGHGATYRLGAGSTSTVISCPEWLDGWLREHGDWIKAADAFAAGDAAGYERLTIKSAAKRIGVLKRGASVATEWKFNPDGTQESA